MGVEQRVSISKEKGQYYQEKWEEMEYRFANIEMKKEIERLHSIIKEVREYIEHENFKRTILVGVSTKKYTRDILNNVLEILDKEVN